jgi:transglutaminase-like putative cysteine protease
MRKSHFYGALGLLNLFLRVGWMRRIALLLVLILTIQIPNLAVPTTGFAADANYGFSFRIRYTVTLTNIDSVMDRVVLYLPIPGEWDSQKSVQIESITPKPYAINQDPDYGNKMAYFPMASGIPRNQSREFTVQYTFTFHQTHVLVDPARVTSYNTSDPNYVKYTRQRPSNWVESDDPAIMETASEIVGNESNPYRKAKLIYDWMVTNIEYKFPSQWGAKQTLLKKGGDCGSQTALFCAMAISQGIPCRAVSGLIFSAPFPRTYSSKGAPSEPADYGSHVYAEFYLPVYGWVPADVSIGRGSGRPEDYFGNTWDFFSIRSKGFGIQMVPPIPERAWLFPHYAWWFWGESRRYDSYYTYQVEELQSTQTTSSNSQTVNIATVVSLTSKVSATASSVYTSTAVTTPSKVTTATSPISTQGPLPWEIGLLLALIAATTISVLAVSQRKKKSKT